MEDQEKVSLLNIKGGAAVEMFDRMLEEVLVNINDINTNTKQRKVTLEVIIAPSEDRTIADIGIKCTPTFQFQEMEKTTADLKIEEGKAVAKERITKQMGIFSNVSSMNKE